MKTEPTQAQQAQHTPGPWTVEKHYPADVSMGGQVVIVAPAPDGASYSEAVANASILGASLDMLEALKAIVRNAGYESGEASLQLTELRVGIGYLDQARAAIAKAEGRQ